MNEDNILLFSKHDNIDFGMVRKVALSYARSKESITLTDLGLIFSIGRGIVTKYLKIAIILSLIDDDDIGKIIDKRVSLCNSKRIIRKDTVACFEEIVELSEERKKILKKLNFFKACFGGSKNYDELYNKNVARLIEIENYAFKR